MMPLEVGLALGLLAFAVVLSLQLRDGLHPAVALTWVWATFCLGDLLLPHGMYVISLGTSVLIVACVTAFALTSLSMAPAVLPARGDWHDNWGRPLLFWIALLGFPLFAMKAQQLAASADITESVFVNLRIALTGENGDMQTYGLLAYLVPVAFTSTLVELAASRSRWFEPRGWLIFVVAIGYAILATGRTYLFLLMISSASVALMQRRLRPSQAVLVGLFMVAAGFIGVGALVNKIGVDVEGTTQQTVGDALSLYVFSGVAAFDHFLAQPHGLDWGLNVLRTPLAVLQALGIPVEVVPLVKEYVFVPEPTNVYTVFLPYVQDFGWPGAVVAFAFLGWMHTVLYRRARAGNPRFVVLYALSMYPLLMQFFQDQYFSLLTTWVIFSALVWSAFAPAGETA